MSVQPESRAASDNGTQNKLEVLYPGSWHAEEVLARIATHACISAGVTPRGANSYVSAHHVEEAAKTTAELTKRFMETFQFSEHGYTHQGIEVSEWLETHAPEPPQLQGEQ